MNRTNWKKNEEWVNPTRDMRPYEMNTDQIKMELGNFENEYDEHIRMNPGLNTEYAPPIIPNGELAMMKERRVINLYPTTKKYRLVWPQCEKWYRLLSLMRELKYRRSKAKEHETKAYEAFA